MGANFEIDIASREYIPFPALGEIWDAIALGACFDEFLIYPDLLFDSTKAAPFAEENMTQERAEGILREGRVLYRTGLTGGSICIGAMQYLEDGCFWRNDLWFDTQGLAEFEAERMTPGVERLQTAVERCLERRGVLFYARGVEMMEEDAASVLETRAWPSALALRFYDAPATKKEERVI